ncbi:hypothetical protein ACFX11_002639 [Malus domestica]
MYPINLTRYRIGGEELEERRHLSATLRNWEEPIFSIREIMQQPAVGGAGGSLSKLFFSFAFIFNHFLVINILAASLSLRRHAQSQQDLRISSIFFPIVCLAVMSLSATTIKPLSTN